MTFLQQLERVILIRHSEAEKTTRQVHGGTGTPLTGQGREDTEILARYLRDTGLIGTQTKIFAGPRPQAIETGQLLAVELNLEFIILDGFRNISMGIFDGLSDTEARARDPQAMRRLELWRAGQLPASEIRMPGGEDLSGFVSRIRRALEDVATLSDNPIIIVTRSVGIALYNLIGPSFDPTLENYNRVRLDPGSVSVFDRGTTDGMVCILQNETGYLKGEREFVDD
jgi:broad specificity phosphatase PhoE